MDRRNFTAVGLAALFAAPGTVRAETQLVLTVNLPSDRSRTGLLSLSRASGPSILSEIKVLGKADNRRAREASNESRDPTLKYGDTPSGGYNVVNAVDTGDGTRYSKASYGPHAALVLDPASGEALVAKQNGRIGLLLHSGDLGTGGRLRATHGCLRVSDADMRRILNAIRTAGDNPVFNRCEVARVSVIVGDEAAEGSGADETDPPPGIEQLIRPVPRTPIRLP